MLPIKRSTRDRIRIVQQRLLKAIGVIIGIGLVITYWTTRNTEIEVVRKGLVCQTCECHLEVVLRNVTPNQLSGKVFVQYIKKERASSNMGINDGFVHRVFAQSNLKFNLKPNEKKVLVEPYAHRPRSPMITATVVIKEGLSQQR